MDVPNVALPASAQDWVDLPQSVQPLVSDPQRRTNALQFVTRSRNHTGMPWLQPQTYSGADIKYTDTTTASTAWMVLCWRTQPAHGATRMVTDGNVAKAYHRRQGAGAR